MCKQDSGDNGASTNPVILGMKAKITEQLEAVSVEIQDLSGGDNQHVAIDVVSEWFDGKNSLQRQRAVYKAIWEEMQVGHIRASPAAARNALMLVHLSYPRCNSSSV